MYYSFNFSIIFIIIYILIIFSIIKKAASMAKKQRQNTPSKHSASHSFDKPKRPNNKPVNQSKYTFESASKNRHIREEEIFGKKPKRTASFFNRKSHEIDCGLDERIFGPKNQHKDIF